MTSIDFAILCTALVLAYGVTAWAFVRLRRLAVKMEKIKFGQEQLQFAREQYNDFSRIRSEQLRHLGGNLPMGVGPFGPPKGGPLSH